MKMLLRCVAATVALAAPAAAQDLVFDMNATRACLAGQETDLDERSCIGLSAGACMEATPSGFSTVGMGGCLDYEYQYWDARLNEAYSVLMESEKGDDLEWGQTVKKADALRAMQRAWIKYRDFTCDYERSQWGGGTGGGPATASCLMRMTGEQALYLEGMMAEG